MFKFENINLTENSDAQIDINGFIYSIRHEPYAIIKFDQNLTYDRGDDIDIFTLDISSLSQSIIGHFVSSYADKFELELVEINEYHAHIDLRRNNDLIIKFDLYERIPNYPRVNIDNRFFNEVVRCSNSLLCEYRNEEFEFNIASDIDDMILRYLEFLSYYEIRPDKLKHSDYLIENLSENERQHFFEKLHYYTELPEPRYITTNHGSKVSHHGKNILFLSLNKLESSLNKPVIKYILRKFGVWEVIKKTYWRLRALTK